MKCEEWESSHRIGGFWKVCVYWESGMPEWPMLVEVYVYILDVACIGKPSLILWLYFYTIAYTKSYPVLGDSLLDAGSDPQIN